MEIDIKTIVFTFFGGLGIFLFSIKYMGDGLKLMAGEKIRYFLDKYTKNPFMGILVGIFVTVMLQSSSASTVITVGLVAVGLLNLRQAIGIVMGANIGTTVTSFVIGFNLQQYALPIMFLGSACLFFTQNQRINNIGRALFGFGGVFFSLKLMSGAMTPLRHVPEMKHFLIYVSNKPVLGVILGTFLTAVIQSSAAMIGILQNLYNDGLISLHGALPILFGDNIGTTITAILSVIGASVVAKRVALVHVLFNVVGTILFLIVLYPFTHILEYIQRALMLNPKLTVAAAHGLFNVTNTILMAPFIGVYVYIVTKLIPSDEEDEEKPENYLDKTFIAKTPSIAISQAHKELVYMYKITRKNFFRSIRYFKERDGKLAEKIENRESYINEVDSNLTKYLSEVFSERITEKESEMVSSYLDITRDVERIGDHANNFSKEISYQIGKKMFFSEYALSEVKEIEDILIDMFEITRLNLEEGKKELSEIYRLHTEIYKLENRARKNHIERMKNQECDVISGLQYVDVLNHFERVSDHLKNINQKIVG